MNNITHWIDNNLAEALGWALLNSLWQGAAIALALAAGLILARRFSSAVRYWMSIAAMLALLAACIATFALAYEPQAEMPIIEEATLSLFATQEALPSGPTPATMEAATDHPTVYFDYFEQHLPLLVTGWLLGVLLLSLRMLGEIAYIQHLRHYRCRRPEGAWLEKLAVLKERMGVRQEVELRETHRIHGPMVVGIFRQVILLPAGLLSGLPPEQLEAVLAHELAHIRRNDYLINLFISLVEILLFFNPMMWWISKKIKVEREHACDDLAVEMTGDTLSLVRSLALMEEWRLNGPSLSMAFMGKEGSVLSRIQRLLQHNDKRQVAAKAFWALSAVCACLALLAFQSRAPQPVLPTDSLTEAVSPEEEALPGEPSAEMLTETEAPAHAEPAPGVWLEPKALPYDTIPADARQIEKEVRQLHEKMRASEMELRKKEQAIRSKELQLRKEAQEGMQAMRKSLMEMEMQLRNKEHEREMLNNEFEIAEHELELAQMKLEEQQHALEFQEEAMEEAEGAERQQKLKAFQQAQKELLEKERALELQRFEAEKKQRMQNFEKDKAIQELQNQRFQMEQELEMKERDMEFKMMGLHHEMEQLEADQRIIEQELEAKARELEMKMREMEERQEE